MSYNPTENETVNPVSMSESRWSPLQVTILLPSENAETLEVFRQACKTKFQNRIDIVEYIQAERIKEIADIQKYLDWLNNTEE